MYEGEIVGYTTVGAVVRASAVGRGPPLAWEKGRVSRAIFSLARIPDEFIEARNL